MLLVIVADYVERETNGNERGKDGKHLAGFKLPDVGKERTTINELCVQYWKSEERLEVELIA